MPRTKKRIGWVALSGSPTITATAIIYHPQQLEEGPGPAAGQPIATVVRSDRYFQAGEITFELYRGSGESSCQVILNHGLTREVWVGLIGVQIATGGACQAGKWEPLATSGWVAPALENQWIRVAVRVTGSLVDLFVDDVRAVSTWAIIEKAQLGIYLWGPAEVRVRGIEISEKKPEAFIVMQFTEEFNALYREVIKPTCEEFGYKTIRADDSYTTGLIVEDIMSRIRDASVVIADITPLNANVFYEVGYSHGIGKETILLADKKSRENPPFDISGFRTVLYDNTVGGKSLVEERLRKHLENLRR